MVKALQELGDRIVGRFVPEVVAEAGVQDFSMHCFCRWGEAWRRNCVAGGGCGSCYRAGRCY